MNETEKKPRSRSRLFSKKIRMLLLLMRPFTLLAPFIGVVSGGVMALAHYNILAPPQFSMEYPFVHWPFSQYELIYCALTFAIANAASNVINQVYDLDIDKINKPNRPLPSGALTVAEAMTFAWLLYILTLFRAGQVSRTFTYFLLIFMVCTIIYTIPPFRLKKRFILNNGVIAVARGLILFVAGWSIFGDPWHPTPWFAGLVLMVFLFGATTSKDFTDIEGDRQYGMRTFPVVIGKKKAALLTAPFFVLPFLLVPVGVWLGYLRPQAIALMGFLVWGGYMLFAMRKNALERDANFENSPLWVHMYLMLMALQIAFAEVYVFG